MTKAGKAPLDWSGITSVVEQIGYTRELTARVGKLGADSRQAELLQKQINQTRKVQRKAGLAQALTQKGKGMGTFMTELGDMGLSGIFTEFMKTGKFINQASTVQINKINQLFNATPDKLEKLRKSLQSNKLDQFFASY